MTSLIPIVIGFLSDFVIGDPFRWHPVIWIGNLISKIESILTKSPLRDKNKEILKGVILNLLVVGISTTIPLVILVVSYRFNLYVGILVEGVMCYQMLAMKSLKVESMKVYAGFKENDIEKARYAVSMIVGRDTKSLTEEGIVKAAVETVAENTADGIIAPLMYMTIFGGCGGYLYKAVNTLDSMVGYKNDKYMYLGRFSAKFDDVLNFIPARLGALFMIIASFIFGYDFKNAFKIFKRDRYNHASPNSAQTEAAMAGALNIELAGDAIYFGQLHKKKTIGDKNREVEFEDIKRANKLMYGTCFVGFAVFVAVRIGVSYAVHSWW